MILNILYYVPATFLEIFQCVPRRKIWNPAVPGVCHKGGKTAVAGSCVNFFSDLVILALPQLVIWRLNMSYKKKVGIALLFAFGVLYV
jgi:hypothetical protein